MKKFSIKTGKPNSTRYQKGQTPHSSQFHSRDAGIAQQKQIKK
jgi:hypothetical protein